MIQIHVDAAFRPKTSEAGLGILIRQSNMSDQIEKVYVTHVADNHQAEFMALLYGLDQLSGSDRSQETLIIYSDSQILVDSIHKDYVKHTDYQPFLQVIRDHLATYPLYFVKYVHESDNAGVDQLAKQALNRQGKITVVSE